MTDYLRVKDKKTKHEYSIPAHLFNDEAHTRLDQSPRDANGDVGQPKFHTTVGKAAEQKKSDTPSAPSGQQADPKKES